jgi:hypothetical protein
MVYRIKSPSGSNTLLLRSPSFYFQTLESRLQSRIHCQCHHAGRYHYQRTNQFGQQAKLGSSQFRFRTIWESIEKGVRKELQEHSTTNHCGCQHGMTLLLESHTTILHTTLCVLTHHPMLRLVDDYIYK